nr:MAG TPA: hypothetical protein [Caudoviricetes sp.]DAU62925.1 MAG TPA: hypothetical protein [Caudoviricetes sp.]DAY78934.1 MAG TPA: hypothetical protein [Caudoviricetes sp.]
MISKKPSLLNRRAFCITDGERMKYLTPASKRKRVGVGGYCMLSTEQEKLYLLS